MICSNPNLTKTDCVICLAPQSDGMVLADIVAGRMDKVQLTFKCHMDTTVRVWHLLPVNQPMSGEFSFGEDSV